jgi:hypothetical protein
VLGHVLIDIADVQCNRNVRLVLQLRTSHRVMASTGSDTLTCIAHNNVTGLLCLLKELASTRVMHYGY